MTGLGRRRASAGLRAIVPILLCVASACSTGCAAAFVPLMGELDTEGGGRSEVLVHGVHAVML